MVKCPVDMMKVPEVATQANTQEGLPSFEKLRQDGQTRLDRNLDRNHALYNQNMCPLNYTGRSPCDFVVMSAGQTFVARIKYDDEFWSA